MPQSKVFTSDKETRRDVKAGLAKKVNLVLDPNPVRTEDTQVLLLPHNYKEFNESELYFILTNNRELQHTYQSAYLAIDLLYERIEDPQRVFKTVVLKSGPSLPEDCRPREKGTSFSPKIKEDTGEARFIDVPESFKSWKSTDQYTYLTKERKLTPELANEVVYYNGTHN